jgi:hypothetical protein
MQKGSEAGALTPAPDPINALRTALMTPCPIALAARQQVQVPLPQPPIIFGCAKTHGHPAIRPLAGTADDSHIRLGFVHRPIMHCHRRRAASRNRFEFYGIEAIPVLATHLRLRSRDCHDTW